MKAALFGSCPNTMGALGVLQDCCVDTTTHNLRFFPRDMSERQLSNYLRPLLAGRVAAVIGFSDDNTHDPLAFQVAQIATRTGKFVPVMTSSGYRRFNEMLVTQLPEVDAEHLRNSVPAIVIVGEDTGTSFFGLETVFTNAKPFEIGGLGWARSSCEQMAAHIAKATNRGVLS